MSGKETFQRLSLMAVVAEIPNFLYIQHEQIVNNKKKALDCQDTIGPCASHRQGLLCKEVVSSVASAGKSEGPCRAAALYCRIEPGVALIVPEFEFRFPVSSCETL